MTLVKNPCDLVWLYRFFGLEFLGKYTSHEENNIEYLSHWNA